MPVKNIIPRQRVAKEKLQRARELRRDMTPVEKALWHELRGNKLGVHFAPSVLRTPTARYARVRFRSPPNPTMKT